MKIIRFLLVFVFFSVANKAMTQTYTYNFAPDAEDWTGDFADYPVTNTLFISNAAGIPESHCRMVPDAK